MSLAWPEGDTDRPTPIAAPQISEVSGCTTAVARGAAAELGEAEMVAHWCEQCGNKKPQHQIAGLAVILGRWRANVSAPLSEATSGLTLHSDHRTRLYCAVRNQISLDEYEFAQTT